MTDSLRGRLVALVEADDFLSFDRLVRQTGQESLDYLLLAILSNAFSCLTGILEDKTGRAANDKAFSGLGFLYREYDSSREEMARLLWDVLPREEVEGVGISPRFVQRAAARRSVELNSLAPLTSLVEGSRGAYPGDAGVLFFLCSRPALLREIASREEQRAPFGPVEQDLLPLYYAGYFPLTRETARAGREIWPESREVYFSYLASALLTDSEDLEEVWEERRGFARRETLSEEELLEKEGEEEFSPLRTLLDEIAEMIDYLPDPALQSRVVRSALRIFDLVALFRSMEKFPALAERIAELPTGGEETPEEVTILILRESE